MNCIKTHIRAGVSQACMDALTQCEATVAATFDAAKANCDTMSGANWMRCMSRANSARRNGSNACRGAYSQCNANS